MTVATPHRAFLWTAAARRRFRGRNEPPSAPKSATNAGRGTLRLPHALCSAFFLVALALNAQAPAAVPLAQEPNHHKVFENSYVHVFRVIIPANQSSLLHRHDLDYVYVSLGPADIINAVQGKPETHPKLVDGQVGYAKGGFAHVATAVGIPFNNVTIELLRPQGEPRNLCDKVIDGPLNCEPVADALPQDPSAQIVANGFRQKKVFETDEILVTSFSSSIEPDLTQVQPQPARLLVAGNDSDLRVEIPATRPKTLHGGEVLWIPPVRIRESHPLAKSRGF
jgi:hypothetical protein